MNKAFAVAALVALPAATVVPQMFMIISPSQVWGVADPEDMMVQVIDGRPSFRRPGDEQCLAKFDDGPIPCDEVETFDWVEPEVWGTPTTVETPTEMAKVVDKGTTPHLPPVFCCDRYEHPVVKPPIEVPPIPIPSSFWLLLTGVFGFVAAMAAGRRR